MKGIQAHEDEVETRRAPKVVKKDAESVKEVGEQQQKEHGLLTWFKKLMKDGNEIDDATFLDKNSFQHFMFFPHFKHLWKKIVENMLLLHYEY